LLILIPNFIFSTDDVIDDEDEDTDGDDCDVLKTNTSMPWLLKHMIRPD
jgi:hypothetical protein